MSNATVHVRKFEFILRFPVSENITAYYGLGFKETCGSSKRVPIFALGNDYNKCENSRC